MLINPEYYITIFFLCKGFYPPLRKFPLSAEKILKKLKIFLKIMVKKFEFTIDVVYNYIKLFVWRKNYEQ